MQLMLFDMFLERKKVGEALIGANWAAETEKIKYLVHDDLIREVYAR
mgnify:FL=1